MTDPPSNFSTCTKILTTLVSPFLTLIQPCFPSLSPDSPTTPTHHSREHDPLLLHVPPSYKSLSLHPPASPRPILKSPTPGARTPEEVEEGLIERDGEGDTDGEEGAGVRKSIRFDSEFPRSGGSSA